MPDDVAQIDGIPVSDLSRAAVETATVLGFAESVVLMDAALRRSRHPVPGVPRTVATEQSLRAELERIPKFHGRSKADRVISFADARSDRPGESMSRASMHLAGVPAPRLQTRLIGASGRGYDVDFWWPEFNVIGEFDGKVKYTDPTFMSGRSAAEVVYDEKLREDDLRAAGRRFVRWPWATAISPTALKQHLARFGVH